VTVFIEDVVISVSKTSQSSPYRGLPLGAIFRECKDGRYGYRKIAELLRVEGWKVNHEKVERLWREEGLQLPHCNKKRKHPHHKDSSIIRLRPKYSNHAWSIDFVHDKLGNGRSYKMPTVSSMSTPVKLCALL